MPLILFMESKIFICVEKPFAKNFYVTFWGSQGPKTWVQHPFTQTQGVHVVDLNSTFHASTNPDDLRSTRQLEPYQPGHSSLGDTSIVFFICSCIFKQNRQAVKVLQ